MAKRKTDFYHIKLTHKSQFELAYYNEHLGTYTVISPGDPYTSDIVTSIIKEPFYVSSMPLGKIDPNQKVFKTKIIQEKMDSLEVGEQVIKEDFLMFLYGYKDWFVNRSFDALFCKYRKENTDKEFRTKLGVITRLK